MKGEISGKHITAIPQSLLYSKVCLASGLLLLLPKLAKKKPVNHLFCSTLLLFCSLIFFIALECMVSPPSSLRPIGSLPVLWQHAACTSNPHGTAAPLLYERCEKIRTLAGPFLWCPTFLILRVILFSMESVAANLECMAALSVKSVILSPRTSHTATVFPY